MDIYTVAFFGHRQIDNIMTVEDKLYSIIVDLMKKHEYVEFLVGRDGAFDILVASVILRAKREYRNDNSSFIWVMPYPKSDYYKNAEEYEGYYDEIEIYSQQNKCHYKSAFQKRNRSMVDRSDLVVFYVRREEGGAYQTLKYAEKSRKEIQNLVP